MHNILIKGNSWRKSLLVQFCTAFSAMPLAGSPPPPTFSTHPASESGPRRIFPSLSARGEGKTGSETLGARHRGRDTGGETLGARHSERDTGSETLGARHWEGGQAQRNKGVCIFNYDLKSEADSRYCAAHLSCGACTIPAFGLGAAGWQPASLSLDKNCLKYIICRS